MSAVLEELLKTTQVKPFSKQFSEYQKEWGDPGKFLAEAAVYLSTRVYARYYDDGAPHAFFGLAAASRSESVFPEDRRWWPYVQQAWFAAREKKRSPFSLNGEPDAASAPSWQAVEKAVSEGEVGSACRSAGTLLQEGETRDGIRRGLLNLALGDTFLGGFKFLYLAQSLSLAERLGWSDSSHLLFPSLHFLIEGPDEGEIGRWAKSNANRVSAILEGDGQLGDDHYEAFESRLLFGDDDDSALAALEQLGKAGVGSEGAWEALIVAAAQAAGNSKSGAWIWPVRALLVAHAARTEYEKSGDSDEAISLLITAGLIRQASRRSRYASQNRDLGDLARRFCPIDTFNTLRSVVSHSDPHAAATAAYAILGMGEEKQRELFQNLATLAAKNDGRIGQGYDLLLVAAAAESFERASSKHKEKLPVCCSFVLARLYKDYDLFGAYGVK